MAQTEEMPKSHYSSLSHTHTHKDKAKIFCLGSNCGINILVMSQKKLSHTYTYIKLNILILEQAIIYELYTKLSNLTYVYSIDNF